MNENYNPEEHRRAFYFNLHAYQAFLQPLIKKVTVKGSIKEILFCLELFEYDRLNFGSEINSELDKEFLLVSYEILSKWCNVFCLIFEKFLKSLPESDGIHNVHVKNGR